MPQINSKQEGKALVNDKKMYLAFAAAGLVIGLVFPPVASFFVEWKPGMLPWFFALCIAAGEVMALTAAVVVRTTLMQTLIDQQLQEKEARQSLQRALRTYGRFAADLAAGNLASRLGEKVFEFEEEEVVALGQQLDATAKSLHDMSLEIAGATKELTAAGNELLTTSAQQATGASEQAAAVAQITTTVEEVRQTAEQAAERAQAVIGTTESAQHAYDDGLAAVEATIESMTELRDRVQSIAHNILSLSERNQRIGEIVESVSELAEQSNLLAINASIEAAKAGESGRGFAVVAGEVRSLAEQSKQATRQVRTIVAEIQGATNSAVMVTEEGSKQAQAGVKLARKTADNLGDLQGIIEESIQSARQIAALSRQQSLGIDQVSEAMRSIQQATRDAEQATRSTETSARKLNGLAGKMSEIIAQHRV